MRLLSFSVANYKSFHREQTIEFNTDEHGANAILGPNGSGKSNLFDAMLFVCEFMKNSTNFQGQQMQYLPFLYSDKSEDTPTSFRIEAELSRVKYVYSFSLLSGKVTSEKLRAGSETIFARDSVRNNRYVANGFDSELLRKTSNQALLLTKAWENENKFAKKMFDIVSQIKFLRGGVDATMTAEKILNDESFKVKALELLQRADLSIQDISVVESKMPDDMYDSLPFKDEFKKGINRNGYDVFTSHIIRGDDGNAVAIKQMPLILESIGTRRIFELVLPLIESIEHGYTLYVDDFESFLHPKECKFIVSLFEKGENENGAKLIINTHNTGVIDQIGRNNIYLFGKNNREESIIGEIKGVRPEDSAIEKKYNAGILGATPNIRW